MNNLLKAVQRCTFTSLKMPINKISGGRQFTRTLSMSFHMPRYNIYHAKDHQRLLHKPSYNCSCGCGIHLIHTKGEKELVEFLTEEVIAEKKTQKSNTIPTALDGFKVKLDAAEVELVKETEKEKIIVSFNINHTVDADDEAEMNPSMDKPEFADMKSKPSFEVDIIKGGNTLSFTCSFLQGTPQEGEYNDIFGIDEITMYEGEWKDKNYAVAGDVLDGYLYDLLMNLLEEKGISNEFVEKLSTLSTTYEHAAYIGLLESLSKFTISKT